MMAKEVVPGIYESDSMGKVYSGRSAPKSALTPNYENMPLKDDKEEINISFLTRLEVIDLKDTDALIAELAEKDAKMLELEAKLDEYERMSRFQFDDFDLPANYYENDAD